MPERHKADRYVEVDDPWEKILALSRENERLREQALTLARWTEHDRSCARNLNAGSCSCGLDQAWAPFDDGTPGRRVSE